MAFGNNYFFEIYTHESAGEPMKISNEKHFVTISLTLPWNFKPETLRIYHTRLFGGLQSKATGGSQNSRKSHKNFLENL